MRKPSDTALLHRARALVQTMSNEGHFVYAVPIEAAREALATCPAAGVTVRVHDELAVALVEAEGVDAARSLAALLERTGFYAQSTLLASACEGGTDDARKALVTLAHMVIAWDDTWRELFGSFARSSDPLDRKAAAEALAVASARAGDPGLG
jgi:hypothetical protein